MKTIAIVAILVILVAGAAFLLYQNEPKADLKIGMLKTVDTVHPLIAKDRGYFDQEGLDVAVSSFGDSTALAEALAAGEVDIAYMSVVPTGVWRTKGLDIIILAGASRGGDMLCTRDGSTSGKIAVSNKGTMTQTLYSYYVAPKFHYEPIYGIQSPDMPTALMVTKDVDAAFVWEPFATQIEENGGTCIFDTGAEWEKENGERYQRNLLVVTGKVAKDPKLVQKLLRINSKTIEFLNQPGSETAIAKAMGIKPLTNKRVEYNSELNWESMVELWGEAQKEGYMTRIPSRSEIVYGG